jgi:hypothetical protein
MLDFYTSAPLNATYCALFINRNLSDDAILERHKHAVSNMVMICEESMTHMSL